jgi:hypothetical protein
MRRRTFPSLPASRDYIHSSCGNVTSINETVLDAICDPFYSTQGTICSACARPFPLDEFAWADTGENIEAYRKRLKSFVPPEYAKAQSLKKLRVALFILLPLAGFAVANLFADRSSPTPFLLSAAVGLVLAIALSFLFPKTPRLNFRRYV